MSKHDSNKACGDSLGQIRDLYTDLAHHPEKDFGWAMGKDNARDLGYATQWLEQLPDAVWESCAAVGNPFSLGTVSAGDCVLDLGCGAGADLCVAALLTGPGGRVIGIDCTPAMIDKAGQNVRACGFEQVEIHVMDFSTLPLSDAAVDVIISNGAINLATDKPSVLAEAFRILRNGGSFFIADMVRTGTVRDPATSTERSWADCVLGTLSPDCFQRMLQDADFSHVEMTGYTGYRTSPGTEGALFRARKPD
ncbi:MAG: methyltransferase domain-containing protein [Gammaproteobacteria bacterium]|nr:methyltransferase domain-containing protein [Gammaproteobacteria bacterium]